MKAIETNYKGYRFRSRLEARWAVFFDALGLEWEYEPEGFDLDGQWYLPDFFIKLNSDPYIGNLWVEIKPSNKQLFSGDIKKIVSFGEHVLTGEMGRPCSFISICGDPVESTAESWTIYSDGKSQNLRRPKAVDVHVDFLLRSEILRIGSLDSAFLKIDHAAKKARSARFEHGECPA